MSQAEVHSMSHSPLRVGVIGCGFFAEDHLAAWAAIEDVTLSAVCDLDIAKARSPAQKHVASHLYTSATDLMDSGNVDFVDVVTTSTLTQNL
jgi:D-apiose dehydrogenase